MFRKSTLALWLLAAIAFSTHRSALSQSDAIPVSLPSNNSVCWDRDTIERPQETFEEFIADVGIDGGFYTDFHISEAQSTLIGDKTYLVRTGEPIDVTLQQYSAEEASHPTRYLVLLDEQPISPLVNGEETERTFFDVTLTSDTIESFNITLPALEAGTHELVLVGIRDWETPPANTGTISLLGYRLTLIAGEPSSFDALTYDLLPTVGTDANGDYLQLLSLTVGEGTVQWSFPEPAVTLRSGEEFQFNVLTGYTQPSLSENSTLPLPVVSRFALLTFLDYEQVPVREEQNVLYGELELGTAYTRIPIVMGDIDPGEHDILVVKIDNPRIPLCLLPSQGVPDSYAFSRDIVHNRARLEVVSP